MGIKSLKAKKRFQKKQMNSLQQRVVVTKDEFQEYGKIVKILGNCRFKVVLEDQKEYLGVLCHRLFKRAWINIDSLVLVSRRDFEDSKVDIIHKYSDEDVRYLHRVSAIPSFFYPDFNDHDQDSETSVQQQPQSKNRTDYFVHDLIPLSDEDDDISETESSRPRSHHLSTPPPENLTKTMTHHLFGGESENESEMTINIDDI